MFQIVVSSQIASSIWCRVTSILSPFSSLGLTSRLKTSLAEMNSTISSSRMKIWRGKRVALFISSVLLKFHFRICPIHENGIGSSLPQNHFYEIKCRKRKHLLKSINCPFSLIYKSIIVSIHPHFITGNIRYNSMEKNNKMTFVISNGLL